MLASKSILTYSRLDEKVDLTQFLIQSGFIYKEAGGVYSYTTLGVLALRRLEDRLHACLQQAGAAEWMLSLLQSQENWDRTGRAAQYGDELMSVKLRSGSIMRLSATAEEQITCAVGHFLKGRAVDHWLYQVGHKWRDEIRSRGGLVRGREFRMMDAYHFVQDEATMLERHTHARDVLITFLVSLGCEVRLVGADCGEIGGQMSEELQVRTDLEDESWMEVGHCFALGQSYAKAFDFTSSTGQAVWMACQGVGTSRLLAVVLNARRKGKKLWGDEQFSVVDDVVVAIGTSQDTAERARNLHDRLVAQGKTVLWEDRFERAGQLLSASEACGAVRRWVVSDRLGDGQAELTTLASGAQTIVVIS
jgi:prolyl-tRNA synthetase